MVLQSLGELETALNYLDGACKLDPANGDFALSLAEAFEQKGHTNEAIRAAQRARVLLKDAKVADELIARLSGSVS